ncbi:hypothetical protein M404DRAFT_163296 [Pisolithus tinctorius Marx 270]|uniref:Uncharacterized protein n=1 Tax=Pisolithus tinctorius Marx 270 TaxID=870435 RepID=A0A0C3IH99_PISTI|nr:hypothetical protein M404DRAFT_163296 [Pisolithus tinctorius Marx 270]
MSENRSIAEGILQAEEGRVAFLGKVPRSTLLCEVSEQNDDVRVVINESSVEVCKAKEELDVLHLPQLRPVMDCLNFLSGHGETGGRENVAKVLDGVRVELALLWLGIETMLSKAAEYLFYVIMVYHNADMEHVCKDTIDKLLESHRHVSQTTGHYPPLIRTIMSMESGFPFISICDADQMIGMAEDDLCVDFSVAWRVKQVRDEWQQCRKWINKGRRLGNWII